MLPNNPIPFSSRVKELFIDWLVISAYLICLLGVSLAVYYLVFGGVPMFSELTSQMIATFASVVPIVFLFSYLDYHGGSIGKRTAKLKLHFAKRTFRHSLLRNTIKFLPWQIGHIGAIRGIYQNYDVPSLILQWIAIVLLILMLATGFLSKDKRHLGDRIAGTQVQLR